MLPDAPIFGDIRAFIDQGFARSYQGLVDVVTAGFPCQPFSVAGKRQGEMDERNMWPDTMRCIELVRPQWVLLENVPGLLAHRYFGRILGDLAKAGYDCRWNIISAYEVGAVHQRERLFIVANSNGFRCNNAEIPKEAYPQFDLQTRQIDIPYRDTDWLLANAFISRKPNDVSEWMERFRGIGNGQVPGCVAEAWRRLTNILP
jgi:DNA (cytosine-5)-methyltransferase 1